MPMSTMPLAERIARVLAGAELSKNANGDNGHAAAGVDAHWKDHLNQAVAVLHTMREADHQMAEAGDPHIWTRMVEAAIQDAE